MNIDLAVVPVAGRGTRLLPLTKSQPKEMLPVGRKPVVQYVVEELARCGMKRILFVTGPGKTAIENHFDIDAELITYLRESGKEEYLAHLSFEREDIEYFYVRQRRQLGLGHAVLCARRFVNGQCFVVALGDSILGLHERSRIVEVMIERFNATAAAAVINFEEVATEEIGEYGVALPKQQNAEVFELLDIVEKPDPERAPSNLAVAGRYVFSPVIFDALTETPLGKGGEIQLTDAIRQLIREGRKVIGVRMPPNERRYDIGHFESYFRAVVEFALADEQLGHRLRRYFGVEITNTPMK